MNEYYYSSQLLHILYNIIKEKNRLCTKYIILVRKFQSIIILFATCTTDIFLMAFSFDIYFLNIIHEK